VWIRTSASRKQAHGGREFTGPERVDAGAMHALERLVPRVPLHQPHNLAPIRALMERAPVVRARVCRDAEWVGVQLDEAANTAGGPRISGAGSAVAAWVIPMNEERVIARHTQRLVSNSKAAGDRLTKLDSASPVRDTGQAR
jgi:acetate kinase